LNVLNHRTNSMENCVYLMYRLSGFVKNLNSLDIQNHENSMEYCVD